MTIRVPYELASSGEAARFEIEKILQRFGCEAVGIANEYATNEVVLYFKHRGRMVTLRASAKGWAAMYLRAHPFSAYRRMKQADYERKALAQGQIAVYSILRDWIKGQVTAIETGILSFESVFMPYMLTHDGRPVIERVMEQNLLEHTE